MASTADVWVYTLEICDFISVYGTKNAVRWSSHIKIVVLTDSTDRILHITSYQAKLLILCYIETDMVFHRGQH